MGWIPGGDRFPNVFALTAAPALVRTRFFVNRETIALTNWALADVL